MATIKSEINAKSSYVIFDGSCGFCNSSALWIAKHDVGHYFLLVSNVSILGKQLLEEQGLVKVSLGSIILVEPSGKVFVKSRAIQQIIAPIPGYSFFKMLMKLSPVFLQNGIYDIIAYFRRSIPLGRTCEVPDEELRKRFRL